MRNRISSPEINDEIIKFQKEDLIISKKHFILTGIIFFIIFLFYLISGSFYLLFFLLISLLDLRRRKLDFYFKKSMLKLLASESLIYNIHSI